jgi:glutaredoxin
MLVKFLRWFVGRIILTLNFVFTPRGVKRDAQSQASMDKSTQSLALYQFNACPFCVKVRRQMKRQSLNIELRDVKIEGEHRQTLLAQGGKVKAPCLRIDNYQDSGNTHWMYESKTIIEYLQTHYSTANAA